MQIQKLIRKEFEELYKKREIQVEIDKDKKGSYYSILVKPDSQCPIPTQGILVEIYKKYLILNIAGWKYYEKIETVESLENLKTVQILDKFLNREMKIKVNYKKLKPSQWKVYLFKQNYWELYKVSSKFFKKLFSFTCYKTCEISIENYLCHS